MTDRDRLIELYEEADKEWNAYFDNSLLKGENRSKSYKEFIADYLLANGVIVPPCKVGDRLYQIVEMNHTAHKHHNIFVSDFPIIVEPYQIVYRNIMGGYSCIPFDDFGKTLFLTKEEAEEKLKERDVNW